MNVYVHTKKAYTLAGVVGEEDSQATFLSYSRRHLIIQLLSVMYCVVLIFCPCLNIQALKETEGDISNSILK